MNITKLGLTFSLTAAFGLVACGDSSSNASGGNTPSCKVTSDDNSVTLSANYQGETYMQKVVLDGDYTIMTTTMKGMPQAEIDEECEYTKEEYRGAEVTCSGNSITVKHASDGTTIDVLKKNAEYMCKEITEHEIDDDDEWDDSDGEEIEIPYNMTSCSVDTSNADLVVMKATIGGVDMVSNIYMDDDYYVTETILKDAPQAKIDEYCAKAKADADEDSIVTCEGDVVTSKVEDPTGIGYSMARAFAPMTCGMYGAQ